MCYYLHVVYHGKKFEKDQTPKRKTPIFCPNKSLLQHLAPLSFLKNVQLSSANFAREHNCNIRGGLFFFKKKDKENNNHITMLSHKSKTFLQNAESFLARKAERGCQFSASVREGFFFGFFLFLFGFWPFLFMEMEPIKFLSIKSKRSWLSPKALIRYHMFRVSDFT